MARRRTPEEIARDFPPREHKPSSGPALVVDGKSKMQGTVGMTSVKTEIREILTLGVREAAPMHVKIAKMEPLILDHDTVIPTIAEAQKAFEICAKHTLPPMKEVVEERFFEDLVEAMGNDSRIPFECIGDIVKAIADKWKKADPSL